MSDIPHHAYDRAMRDAWRRWPVDLVEGLLGRNVPGGATPLDPNLERGPLEVDALVADNAGTPIHVEFQTRQDRSLGFRMARYFTALDDPSHPPPEQHVVLLHPSADFAGIGAHRRGGLHLSYGVHRLWEADPETLLARTGLLRLVPLARAASSEERVELLTRAARTVAQRLGRDDPTNTVAWTGLLATLYLNRNLVTHTLEDLQMPIDLSDTSFAKELRAEARREDIQRIVRARFDDEALAARATAVTDDLLEEAIDHAATAQTPENLAAWLQANNA